MNQTAPIDWRLKTNEKIKKEVENVDFKNFIYIKKCFDCYSDT